MIDLTKKNLAAPRLLVSHTVDTEIVALIPESKHKKTRALMQDTLYWANRTLALVPTGPDIPEAVRGLLNAVKRMDELLDDRELMNYTVAECETRTRVTLKHPEMLDAPGASPDDDQPYPDLGFRFPAE